MVRSALLASGRLAGQVRRYHTWPIINQQSVGEHSWQVLRIYFQIFGAVALMPHITIWILWHDCGELVTGDPPYPFKAKNPEIKKAYDAAEDIAVKSMGGFTPELSPHEKRKVKTCDLIDMLEYGQHEKMMGNQFAQPIIDDISNSIRALWLDKRSPIQGLEEDWRMVEEYLLLRDTDWRSIL